MSSAKSIAKKYDFDRMTRKDADKLRAGVLAEEKEGETEKQRTEMEESLESLLRKAGTFAVIPKAEELISSAEKNHISIDFTNPYIVNVCQQSLGELMKKGYFEMADELISFTEKKGIPLDLVSACQRRLESCFQSGYSRGMKRVISLIKEKNLPFNI